MKKIKLTYKLLKGIWIISTVSAIIMFIKQYHAVTTNSRASLGLMPIYIHIIVTCIWSYLMGILMIIKAYLLYKEGKVRYCIGLLLAGLLIIVFSHYIIGFLLFPFYNA